MTSATVLGAFVWVFAASMRDRVILGGTGLKHQWDYTRNEHYPEYPYSDVITWHGKLPAQSGFAPTLPRRAADLRKSWDLFLGWFSWVWLRAKLHGKAELSVLLLFKHDFKKLTALSFMFRPCLWNSFKSITREQRDPRECGVPGSAVSPSPTVNSQKDPGTKPPSSEWHKKADKDVRQELRGFTQVNHEGKLALGGTACWRHFWNLPGKSHHKFVLFWWPPAVLGSALQPVHT